MKFRDFSGVRASKHLMQISQIRGKVRSFSIVNTDKASCISCSGICTPNVGDDCALS